MRHVHHLVDLKALGQGMGDEQHRHLPFQGIDGLGEGFGRLGIQGAGGFVEDQDLWLFEQGPRNGQALLLPAFIREELIVSLSLCRNRVILRATQVSRLQVGNKSLYLS
jgi:hypothetical protein